MSVTAGYQVYFTLEGGGGLLVCAELPSSVVTSITLPASQTLHGQPSLIQEAHDDPAGCAALLSGYEPESVGRQYLDLYRYNYGDEIDMTILPPGATRQFTLGGQDGRRAVLLTVRTAPPDGIEVIAYTCLPNGQCVAAPSVQDRYTDPGGYAALMSGIHADEVARRYAMQYEGRFGKIASQNNLAPASTAAGGTAPILPGAFSRWAWIIPVLIALTLIGGLLASWLIGIGHEHPDRHAPIVTPGQQDAHSHYGAPEGMEHHGGRGGGDDD